MTVSNNNIYIYIRYYSIQPLRGRGRGHGRCRGRCRGHGRGAAAAEFAARRLRKKKLRFFCDFRDFWDFLANFEAFLIVFWSFGRFFQELGFFGARQMIPWVILLWMHIFSSLCDPWGS